MKKLIFLLVIGISILMMFTGCDELFSLLGVSPDTYDLQAEDVFLNAAGTEVSFTVYNGGSLSVPSAEVWIVLSGDLVIDRNDPTVFSQFISVGAGLSQATTINVSDFDLTDIAPGTYYIGIIVDPNSSISDDNGGNNSTYAITQLTIGGGGTTGDVPAIPTNFMVDTVTSGSITVSWIVVSNADGYNLQWGLGSSGPWSDVPGYDGAAANFTHISLSSSTTYWYRVEALNSYGASGFTTAIFDTTLAGGGTVPLYPLNLIVDNPSASTLDISWDAETNTTGYNLERSNDGGTTWTTTGFTGSATSYTDFGLTSSTTYLYQVEAYNTYGGSGFSPAISATTLAGGGSPPLSPLNLMVDNQTSNSLDISWDPETDATGYNLERSDDGGTTWVTTGFTGSATFYTDFGLTSSTTYEYRVEAYNTFGNSGFSPWVPGTTTSGTSAAPQLVNANGFMISSGAWSGMGTATLQYSDADSTDDNIQYTLNFVTAGSELWFNYVAIGPGYVFTQADINTGYLQFNNLGSPGSYEVNLSVFDNTGNPGNPPIASLIFNVLP